MTEIMTLWIIIRTIKKKLITIPETMNHLLPLVGYGTDLRARVFRPDGWLLADTARSGAGGEVELRRRQPGPTHHS